MIFTSGEFFYFYLSFFVLYLFSQRHLRTQNSLLLLASYFFYGYWDYRFLALILLSTLVDFVSAQQVEICRKNNRSKNARYWLWLSIISNLSILGFFKYYNFFIESFTELLTLLGVSVNLHTLEIILPVGISFYTFQTMSYTIDVYRGRQKASRSPINFALFVAFFPQLMAGPIERAKKLLPQIEKNRIIRSIDIREGGWLILWGMFKKVFIADNLAPYTYWAFIEGGAVTTADVYLASFAFVIQFYCDFSGYSDMARGMARLMGFNLSLNFNLPYFASNPSELWRRWHITLSNWFRDYVYGELRRIYDSPVWRLFSLILTMMLVGLWHGPTWGFIIWGALWGLALAIHFVLKPTISKIVQKNKRFDRYIHWSGVFITFYLWAIIGSLFISTSLAHALSIMTTMVTGFDASPTSGSDAVRLLFYTFPIITVQIIQYRKKQLNFLKNTRVSTRLAFYIFLLLLLWTNGSQYQNEFIYFQF